ncbi:hypothetical protein BDV93DRAFT_123373 [Ceratobasidium sp. AG-I]|nr:hypothetical protein BDV93DRAFT_123373 [Ceratobasidium sp. AG-I]
MHLFSMRVPCVARVCRGSLVVTHHSGRPRIQDQTLCCLADLVLALVSTTDASISIRVLRLPLEVPRAREFSPRLRRRCLVPEATEQRLVSMAMPTSAELTKITKTTYTSLDHERSMNTSHKAQMLVDWTSSHAGARLL